MKLCTKSPVSMKQMHWLNANYYYLSHHSPHHSSLVSYVCKTNIEMDWFRKYQNIMGMN